MNGSRGIVRRRNNMNRLSRIVIATLLATAAVQGSSTHSDYEVTGDGFLQKIALIHERDFTREMLLTLARDFLRQHRNKTVAQLLIVIREEQVSTARFGKGQFHYTFEQWQERYQNWGPISPQAELIKLGKSAAIRVLWPDGTVQTELLEGTSVFCFALGDVRLELLHVAVVPGTVIGRKRMSFFFRTSRPVPLSESSALVSALRRKIALPSMQISFRPDGWFIADAYYPWRNAFDAVTPITNWNDYRQRTEVTCMSAATVHCKETPPTVRGRPLVREPLPLPNRD